VSCRCARRAPPPLPASRGTAPLRGGGRQWRRGGGGGWALSATAGHPKARAEVPPRAPWDHHCPACTRPCAARNINARPPDPAPSPTQSPPGPPEDRHLEALRLKREPGFQLVGGERYVEAPAGGSRAGRGAGRRGGGAWVNPAWARRGLREGVGGRVPAIHQSALATPAWQGRRGPRLGTHVQSWLVAALRPVAPAEVRACQGGIAVGREQLEKWTVTFSNIVVVVLYRAGLGWTKME
jgi:hypothetical protein